MDKLDLSMAVPAGLGIGMITYAFYANHELNQLKDTDKETILKVEDLRKELDNKMKDRNVRDCNSGLQIYCWTLSLVMFISV